jgi:peptidoglycan hydrolase-like protein with peptidoglycan-binding domain
MSSLEQRQRMAKAIVDFEARRDRQRRLVVHRLRPSDGGGRYEVAGINERYHKETVDVLVALIEQGRYAEAEDLVAEYVGQYTDRVITWSGVPALEFYLRDSVFNRGPAGGARILQRALGVEDDGVVGSQTKGALRAAEVDALDVLAKLRAAREQYERDVARRNERSEYWRGLVNRWNKAIEIAKSFPLTATNGAVVPTTVPASVAPAGSLQEIPEGPVPAVVPALRIGLRGDRVAAWQTFLTGRGFETGPTDGIFGEMTRNATMAFQQKHGLVVDGVAGRQTLLKAANLGFELIEEPAADATSSNFPPRPNFSPLLSDAQRAELFGHFHYVHAPVAGNPENIRILGSWQSENIVNVAIPQLRAALGPRAAQTMQFHRRAARQLQGLWSEWEAAGLLDRVLTYEGAFVPRFIRGSTSVLSNHAFGSAFDINYAWNKLGARPALVGSKGCVRELVPIAHRWGFYWGGHFNRRPDGMHFEIAILK